MAVASASLFLPFLFASVDSDCLKVKRKLSRWTSSGVNTNGVSIYLCVASHREQTRMLSHTCTQLTLCFHRKLVRRVVRMWEICAGLNVERDAAKVRDC